MALFLLVVLLSGALVAGGVVALAITASRRPAPAPSQAAEAARRHANAVNLVAWLAASITAVPAGAVLLQATSVPYDSRYPEAAGAAPSTLPIALCPAAVGLAFLAVHAVGERSWPRPTGAVRHAALVPREDPAPRWLRRVTWAWAAALVAVLITTGLTATDGRTFSRPDPAESGELLIIPYPGWSYAVPLIVVTVLIVAATEGVLWLVARRPAVIDADPAYDAASRRLSAHRVLRGVQLLLAGSLAGVLAVTGVGVLMVDAYSSDIGTATSCLGGLVGMVGVALAIVPARPAVQTDAGPQPPPLPAPLQSATVPPRSGPPAGAEPTTSRPVP